MTWVLVIIILLAAVAGYMLGRDSCVPYERYYDIYRDGYRRGFSQAAKGMVEKQDAWLSEASIEHYFREDRDDGD